MKRPYPDIGAVVTNEFIKKLAYVRNFVRHWGTTIVEGEEVLLARKYYYKDMDDSTIQLTKMLGIYEDLKNAKMKGVKKAWMYLNPNKEGTTNFDATILKNNLNIALSNLPDKTQLVIGPKVLRVVHNINPIELLAPALDTPLSMQTELIAEVEAEYRSYFYSDYFISTNLENNVYLSILLKYLLLSDDVDYTITKVSKGYTDIQVPSPYTKVDANGVAEKTAVYSTRKVDTFIIDIDIHSTSIQSDAAILTTIGTDASKGVSDAGGSVNTVIASNSLFGGLNNGEPTSYIPFVFNDVRNFWIDVGELSGHYDTSTLCLKKSVLTGNVLSLDQKISLIKNIIDTDYEQKSVPFWKTLLVLVVFLVVVVYSAGQAIGPATAAMATAVAVAGAITLGALAVSLLALIAMATGNEGMATSSALFLKGIEPLVQIASIVAIVGSLYTMAQNGAKEIVAKEAAKEGAKNAATEVTQEMVNNYLKDNVVASVMQGVKSTMATTLSSATTNISLESSAKMVNMVFGLYKDNEMKSIQSDIKDEKAKLAQFEQEEEEARSKDILKAFSRIQFSPMTSDNSVYSLLYDKPYEPWSSAMHIGNIQANYVNALWLSK